MTISSQVNRWAYTGNGSMTHPFTFTSRIFADSDLRVYVAGALKTLVSDYSVVGAGSPSGGYVQFTAAPANGAPVVILRDVPATQGLDLAALGSFPAEENEKALDRLTVLAQQASGRIDRTLRQPGTDDTDLALLPGRTARAGRIMAFDGNGNPTPGAVALPASLTALAYPRVDAGAVAYELRAPAQVRGDIGADDAGNLTAGTVANARLAANLQAEAALSGAADKLGYFTGAGAKALTDLTGAGRTLLAASTQAAQRAALALGTIATQDAGAVAISGGSANFTGAVTLATDPDSAMKAATKQYVDSVAAGLGKRGSVRAATTANITLSGLQTFDGVSVGADDLVLVKNQSTQAGNGIYRAAAGAWARDVLFDIFAEIAGALIAIEEGSAQADTLWLCTANQGGTLGTTAVTWAQIFPGSGGTVSNIATTEGIQGGPITSAGTLKLDVSGLTEDTAPDLTADFVPSWDVSASLHKKVKLQNIGGVAVQAQTGDFTAGTTPNVLHVVAPSGASADCTLPAASGVANGFRLMVKNDTDGKGVRLLRAGSDTIDGQTSFRVPGRETVEVTRTAAATWTVTARPAWDAGTVREWYTDTLPEGGWAWCNAQALSRTTCKGLFDIWGTTFGAGDGSTTFNVLDKRGYVTAGKETLGGATAANRLQKTTTITTSNGSASATVGSAADLCIGMYVLSANVPAGITIAAISGTSITLSTGSGVTAGSGTAARFSLISDPQNIGGVGGQQSYAHGLSEIAAHEHFTFKNGSGSNGTTASNSTVITDNASYTIFSTGAAGADIGRSSASGGGNPLRMLQPTIAANYIVKL